jgi:hypothetical protein
MQHSPFPPLPCYPCPHRAACCAYGTTLSDDEARIIRQRHGAHLIYQTRTGEWRTRVRNRRCVFLADNVCTIYNQPYYPAVCRGFPWLDAETGGPYEFDRDICPEFVKRPELYEITPTVRTSSPASSSGPSAPPPRWRRGPGRD